MSYFLRRCRYWESVSNISSNEKNYKYFNHKVKPLQIMLPKISTYLKRYDGQTKCIYFLIENDGLFEKYNSIWNKVCTDKWR